MVVGESETWWISANDRQNDNGGKVMYFVKILECSQEGEDVRCGKEKSSKCVDPTPWFTVILGK